MRGRTENSQNRDETAPCRDGGRRVSDGGRREKLGLVATNSNSDVVDQTSKPLQRCSFLLEINPGTPENGDDGRWWCGGAAVVGEQEW